MKWEMVKLGDAFILQMGKTPSRNRSDFWKDGENDWASISDMGDEKYIVATKESISSKAITESGIKIVPKDTVIMSFKLSLGKACITAKNMYTNEAIMAFINNGLREIDNSYLYYCLKRTNWIEGTNKAVKGITLNKATLQEMQIPIPPIEIQCKIAKVLDKASELIDKRKKQIALLDQLVKSVFIDMFGDPVTNPKGWEVKRLGDKCEVITGNTPPRSEKNNYGDYIEWIKSDNINTDGFYLTNAVEYLSEEGYRKCRYVNEKCVLMTCIAGSISCIGNVAIANRKVAFNQQINAILSPKNNVFFLYVLFLLTKPYIQSTINMSLKGILSKGQLLELNFIFPPIELQDKFAAIIENIVKLREQLSLSLEKLELTYKSLMQKAFNGELFC